MKVMVDGTKGQRFNYVNLILTLILSINLLLTFWEGSNSLFGGSNYLSGILIEILFAFICWNIFAILINKAAYNRKLFFLLVLDTLLLISIIILKYSLGFFQLEGELFEFSYHLYYFLKGALYLYFFKVTFGKNPFKSNLGKEESEVNQLELNSYKRDIKRLKMERHDFKNQLQVIYTMLELDKVDKVKNYLKELCSDLEEVKESLVEDSLLPVVLLPKREEARRAGIDFEVKSTANLEQIALPQKKLFRILFNLIDNALDVLDKSSQDNKFIGVKLLDKQNRIDLVVQNNGPTIPQSLLASIFEAGYSTKGEDRGFGLYIVKSLLEEYGGKINVTTKEDFITEFICTLPKVQRT
ncbi:hypothetical protein U472_01525 [Orenia metallireducens]|uniref:histidine kinase n=2 Tax=Orenia metallireducens TaxID=1413210 RepID=A0A1C0ABZ1_9FIRM|nr:hypothetical protein U472_01525 [Orenia metallireducens]